MQLKRSTEMNLQQQQNGVDRWKVWVDNWIGSRLSAKTAISCKKLQKKTQYQFSVIVIN